MKVLVLTALLALVASSRLDTDNQTAWPWQTGNLYRYQVTAHTVARLPEGASSGSAFRATFLIRVKTPGTLLARLLNPQHAKFHQELLDTNQRMLPEDLKYEPVQNLELPFEINLTGGRVLSLKLPSSIPLAHENLLKGLISTLQVDLSTHRTLHNAQNNYDQETWQGQFNKMETDVTGDCATLYTVSPAGSDWHRELPYYPIEEPMIITKSKNYGHCHHRVDYHFGVPQGAEWTGVADKPRETQFINRATNSRIIVGRQGPIFRSETTSTVKVHPHVYGQQKAEVLSYVALSLEGYVHDNEPEWQLPEDIRLIKNLLYSLTTKQMAIHDQSEEDFEVEDVQVNEPRARRSIRMPKKIVAINKVVIIKKRNDAEDTDDSASDSTSAYVNDDMPLSNEPAYAALYMNPQGHKTMKQNPANGQKLVQELAQLLQNANNMPKSDFLSKFNILVRIIAAMDFEQLSQTSRGIEGTKTSNNPVKADMWMIYRDAVVQAGTLPAFKQIVSWIQTKKMQGEEAAQVIATLANTLRYPTKNTMIEFFELALMPEVSEQKYLNSTALIAATRFINMGQVNNETAHSFYPTHMYGRLAHQYDNFVYEQILPRLSQVLDQAIQQGDSRKAQVYFKAIGQLGHRSILEVYAPYLEGKVRVSTYLRALMVKSLETLAHQKDSYVRAALFSILRNTAEPDEVRVAAIQTIFKAHPTNEMMQAMAFMTHDDPSIQVRAVLKTGIESAAEQKNPRYLELARVAQAARPMLTKEMFGKQYSSKNFGEYFDSNYELGIMDVLDTIGSEDSLVPKYLSYKVRSETSGWNKISSSFSSFHRFVQKFQEQMKYPWRQSQNSETNHKYSADKISEMLNIKRDPEDPLEAALYISLMNQQRYFTFSEDDLNRLPNMMREAVAKLAKGVDMHYTKIFNQAQISVMFPVAMGMPFIYRYKEPTVVHILAKAKGDLKFGQEQVVNVQNEIQFTFARNIDGNVGFLDTLSNEHASAGVVNKVQLYIPLKVDLEMKKGEVQMHLQTLRPEQDTTIVHYSVWPYTTIQKKDTLTPISLDANTKLIARDDKVVSIDTKFGQQVKIQYQVQGYSYSTDYRNWNKMFQSQDLLSNIIQYIYQKDVAMTHFNFRYLGSKTQNKRLTLTTVYDEFYNLKETAQEPLTASKVQDVSPNSAERRAAMVKRVAVGIQTARARVIDFSAVFDNSDNSRFVFTAAMADSHIDPKIQYAFFASKNIAQSNSQINGVGKVIKPEITALNAVEALKKELKITFDADIKFGENDDGYVNIQTLAERTKSWTEALQKTPLAKRCAEQMTRNNFYQHECHKMVVLAHTPDFLKASVTCKDVSPAAKYMIFQTYKIVEKFTSWNADVNPLKTIPEGKLEVEMLNNYWENVMSLRLNSRYGEVRIKNMPILRVAAGAMSTYSPFRPDERVGNYYFNHLYQPYCTVDDNQIKTFSQRRYNYSLSPSWHVVLQDIWQPQQQQKQGDQLVVLARRPTDKQQEIYISYKSEYGQNLEIEIQPAAKPNVRVNTDAKKVSDGELTMYWDEVEQLPFLEYFIQPDGVLMLNIRQERLRVMYDGVRTVLLAKDYRNNTRGICGQMSGEPRDDYLTPYGLVDKDEHFAASYALVDGADQKTLELQTEAQRLSYHRRYVFTNIMKSDSEWKKWKIEDSSEDWEDWRSRKVYRSKVYKEEVGCEMQKQVQYSRIRDEICISRVPVDACARRCKSEGWEVRAVEVACSWRGDAQWIPFQDLVQRIRAGQNPPRPVTGANQIRQYRVPISCQA